MEMQGGHATTRRLPPPTSGYDSPGSRRLGDRGGHFSPPPPELPAHLSRGPSREHLPEHMKNKIEVSHVLQLSGGDKLSQYFEQIFLNFHTKPITRPKPTPISILCQKRSQRFFS